MCFLCFFGCKFSRKKQRRLKLSKETKTNKTVFLCEIKTSKRKKVACLTFCAFYVFGAFYTFYARIKRRSETRLFDVLYFLCFLCFLCVWKTSEWKLFICVLYFLCFLCVWNLFLKENKTALIPSIILLLKDKSGRLEKIRETKRFW